MRRSLGALAGLALAAYAQIVPPNADWKEAEVPPPPAVQTERLIPLELPPSGLRFGVDPASVVLGDDGVIRYVVVATSASGAVNAMYEGIRCDSAQFKVFARYNPGSGWVKNSNLEWQSLHDAQRSAHTLVFARTGGCVGHSANRSAAQIVRDLRSTTDRRFNQPQ
jgi:hypothetical protein